MKRPYRIAILLFILFLVGMDALLTRWRTTDWDQSIIVAIYPINGDRSEEATNYIHYVTEENFRPVAQFINREAGRYGVELTEPLIVMLAPELNESPPSPPQNGGFLSIVWWSLKIRYWNYKTDSSSVIPATIRVYVRYHAPVDKGRIPESLGMEKGHVCIVNAYASPLMMTRNQVIITHEILHTLGATDKYDLTTEMPLYPDGYADPDQNPFYPQSRAEIMGGYVAITENHSEMPASLADTVIGPLTAEEIGWREQEKP